MTYIPNFFTRCIIYILEMWYILCGLGRHGARSGTTALRDTALFPYLKPDPDRDLQNHVEAR